MHAWSSAGLVKISICCFSAKNAVLRSKRTDWLVWNQDNVSEWIDMSIHGLLLVEHNKNPIQHIGLVQADLIIISLKIYLLVP
jgi:hypothetical protein